MSGDGAAEAVAVRETDRAPRSAAVRSDRPSISPLLWAAAAAWLASALATECALRAWASGEWWPLAAGWAAASGVVAGGIAARRHPTGRLVACIAAAAMCVALVRGGWMPGAVRTVEAAGVRTWGATVIADPVDGRFGTSVQVRLDGLPWQVTALVNWPKGEPAPRYGERLTVSGRLRVPLRAVAASADAFRSGTMLRASPWRVAIEGWAAAPLGQVAAWRSGVIDRLRSLRAPGADTVATMLFGVPATGGAVQALDDARTSGVAWAVGASGLHLAAIVLVAERLATFAGLGRRGRAWAVVAVLGVLLLGSAFKLSLLRAAFASGVAAIARGAGRRRDGTAALGAVLVVVVLLDSAAAYDTGLLLGSLAVAAILVFGRLAAAWIRPIAGRAVGRALGASVAAQVAVAPVVAGLFGGVALLGPVVLVLSGPLAGTAVSCAAIGACLPVPPLSEVLLRAAAALADLAARLWAFVAAQPQAYAPTEDVPLWVGALWVAGAGALWLRWPVPRRAARARLTVAAAVVAVAVAGSLVRPSVGTGVVVMDVGQGDAVLIRDGVHAVLVDTGPDPTVLRRALARQGIHALDGVVLTHAHEDHIGGLDGLQGVARPSWIAVPDVDDADVARLAETCASRAGRVVRLRRDMVFDVGALHVRVLWPQGGERGLSANDTSVVLLLEGSGERAVLLGDAEERAQRGALKAWSQPVNMLKVAHHGSPNGNVPDALAAWHPAVALISVGAGNTFGHPSQTALTSLAAVGARIERTDRSGDLAWEVAAPVARASAAGVARAVVHAAVLTAAPALCDNPDVARPSRWPPGTDVWTIRWPPPTSPISSRSTSSTVRSSCCSSARRSACATVSPPWRTSTSTWRPSTGIPPPPPTS